MSQALAGVPPGSTDPALAWGLGLVEAEPRICTLPGPAGDAARRCRLTDAAVAEFRDMGMTGWIRQVKEEEAS